MTGYLNAVCSICGKQYHVCNDCRNARTFTPWRSITDTMGCYKIFLALRDYTNGCTTREATREILQRCDLSELETFEAHIKNAIKDILNEDSDQGVSI